LRGACAFLRKVIWTVPDFTVDRYSSQHHLMARQFRWNRSRVGGVSARIGVARYPD
jgi:hypothetical protein